MQDKATTVEERVIEEVPIAGVLDVNDVFKKALFMSKGATNNKYAYVASQTGMSPALIVQYYSNLRTQRMLSRIVDTSHPTVAQRIMQKKIRRELKRVVDVFDTLLGRRMVDTFGRDYAHDLLVGNVYCNYDKIVVTKEVTDVLSFYDAHEKTVYDARTELLLPAYVRIKKVDAEKIKSKELAFTAWRSAMPAMPYALGGRLSSEFKQDFAKAHAYDVEALANIPADLLQNLPHLHGETADISCNTYALMMQQPMTEYSQAYGPDMQRNTYCSLLFRGMYDAMKELGVGLYPLSVPYAVRRNKSAFNMLSKKIIILNERYQKMLKRCSKDGIEPVIIRQQFVNMFNDYAKMHKLGFGMFVREDKALPTLAEMQDKKKTKKASTKAKTSRKSTTIVESIEMPNGSTKLVFNKSRKEA